MMLNPDYLLMDSQDKIMDDIVSARLKKLCGNPTNINFQYSSGQTLLMLTLEDEHPDLCIIKAILKRPEINVNLYDMGGNNALHYSLRQSYHDMIYKICKLLIKHGIDINRVGAKSYTPLMLATRISLEVVNLLLNQPQINVNLQTCKYFGGTAFYHAMHSACKSRLDICRALIAAGFNVNLQDMYCRNILMQCIRWECYELCHCNWRNQNSPLQERQEYIQIIEMLLEAGADTFSRDRTGGDALHYATQRQDREVMQTIIRHRLVTAIKAAVSATNNYFAVLPRDIREYIVLFSFFDL